MFITLHVCGFRTGSIISTNRYNVAHIVAYTDWQFRVDESEKYAGVKYYDRDGSSLALAGVGQDVYVAESPEQIDHLIDKVDVMTIRTGETAVAIENVHE